MAEKSKLILGCDLDGVVGNYESIFREYVSKDKNVEVTTIGPQTSWDFTESGWPISSRDEFIELHKKAVVEEHMFANMPVMENASEVLWRLSKKGVHIIVVTHRLMIPGFGHNKVTIADTIEWLDKNNIPYRDICFIADKPRFQADLYIDDAEHNIVAMREAGIPAVVFDQKYNQKLSGPRVHNWLEFEVLVDRMLESGSIEL